MLREGSEIFFNLITSFIVSQGVPLPELVEELTKGKREEEEFDNGSPSKATPWDIDSALDGLAMSDDLLRVMRVSLHPPHKIVGRKQTAVPNAAFPYCYYENKDVEGVKHESHEAKYCDSFQVRRGAPLIKKLFLRYHVLQTKTTIW